MACLLLAGKQQGCSAKKSNERWLRCTLTVKAFRVWEDDKAVPNALILRHEGNDIDQAMLVAQAIFRKEKQAFDNNQDFSNVLVTSGTDCHVVYADSDISMNGLELNVNIPPVLVQQNHYQGIIFIESPSHQVVVWLEGGVVQGVVADQNIDVAIIEFDKEADQDERFLVSQADGTDAIAVGSVWNAQIDPERTAELRLAVEDRRQPANMTI